LFTTAVEILVAELKRLFDYWDFSEGKPSVLILLLVTVTLTEE